MLANAQFESMKQPVMSLSVLVVDDDEFQRKLITHQLKHYGVQNIKHACDGIEAVQIVRSQQENFDLILSDLDMPNMDGMELIRILSEHNCKVPVAISSGWDASFLNSVQTMCMAYGVTPIDVLQKPISRDGIGRVLEKVLLKRDTPIHISQCAIPEFTLDEILEGIRSQQFVPFYQPKLDLSTGKVTSAEALARWVHPVYGVIAPYAFIDKLESAGEIESLTFAMIRQAARDCSAWQQAGFAIDVSVNLSITSLADRQLGEKIYHTVCESKLSPKQITLEITETAAMTDMARALETLARLRMRGFGLSIDDFGTGFASMQHLSRVAFTELKIDRGFVAAIFETREARAIVDSSIDIAKRVGIKSVAEGVESIDELNALQEAGCDLAQGYFIAKPLALSDFINFCRDERN